MTDCPDIVCVLGGAVTLFALAAAIWLVSWVISGVIVDACEECGIKEGEEPEDVPPGPPG